MQDQPTGVPYGHCYCGCGEETTRSPVSHARLGYVKGQPRRFVRGHTKPLSERFAYVERDHGFTTPCHDWTGCVAPDGYARLFIKRRPIVASRYIYEQAHGELPGYRSCHVDHLCRNRLCVRLDHLEAVTAAENVRRGAGTRLTEQDVAGIRARCATGENQGTIAEAYGVTRKHVNAIYTGARWSAPGGAVHAST